jgi:inner membrane transporter RhtA
MSGLALTIPIAALTAGIFGIPQAIGNLSLNILLAGFGLAILLPIIPYALELMALRRMTSNAFGTLMALEPAIGVILGILILQQIPNSLQVIGILLVVYAGASAQRGGLRNIIG